MVFFLDCVQVRVGKSRRKESPGNDWLPRGGGGFPELGDPPPSRIDVKYLGYTSTPAGIVPGVLAPHACGGAPTFFFLHRNPAIVARFEREIKPGVKTPFGPARHSVLQSCSTPGRDP